ncbi:hypothetical protein FKP32DRAFT_1155826 [Trametes sanguinea]|nr:hypothetical protein FKP32DRAFT_1155826 [Trametes sanguinea]
MEVVVYLILRTPHWHSSTGRRMTSCIAWQEYPIMHTPMWSPKLFVDDPMCGKWTFMLAGIRIWHGPEWNDRSLSEAKTTPPTAEVPMPEPCLFDLDTGAYYSGAIIRDGF